MGPAQPCFCTVCHLNASSIPGTTHRRCAGKVGESPRKPQASRRQTWFVAARDGASMTALDLILTASNLAILGAVKVGLTLLAALCAAVG
jgi:hypothetical protein